MNTIKISNNFTRKVDHLNLLKLSQVILEKKDHRYTRKIANKLILMWFSVFQYTVIEKEMHHPILLHHQVVADRHKMYNLSKNCKFFKFMVLLVMLKIL